MPDEAKFVIDKREYEIPAGDSFTMGEALTLYEYSGLTLDQLADEDTDTSRHPGVMAAFMHIAYERGNPGVSKAKVKALIANANIVEAMEQFIQQGQEEEARPPEPQRSEPPTPPSPESSPSSEPSSGAASTNGSGEPGSIPAPTGSQPTASSASALEPSQT